MASPNATFTEMVTTTHRNHPARLADNVSNHNGLLSRLKKRGKIRTENGGYELVEPLEYSENGTYQRYDGYDALDVSASDVLSAAKYDWVNVAIHVTANGPEIRKNSGEEAMMKLVKSRVSNAYHTAANQFSTDLYSDGSATNQLGGLAHIIQTAGTGTVGGINSTTYTFWQNQVQEMTGTDTYASIKADMNRLWLKCVRGADRPDLLVSTHDLYIAYESTLQDQQRYSTSEMASAGFESLKYKSSDLIFDDNDTNFTTTGEKMYFVNTNYLYLVQHAAAKWTEDSEKVPVNQDAVVIPIYWMGQLVCRNRALQGVMIDAA